VDPHEALNALAEAQHGLATRAQARGLGFSDDAVVRLARSSGWEAVTRRVLGRRGAPHTQGRMLMAAVLDAGGDAALGYACGGRWWGLRGCSLTPVFLATTMGGHRTDLAVTRRVRSLPDNWSTVLRGVPVVRPELLALHLFADVHPARAERLVDRLWSMRLLSGASIARFLDDMGASGRNGTAGLRRYLKPRGLHYVPPASGLESRAMELFDRACIPMRRQVDSGGEYWTGRVDFRHEWQPLIVEVQSEMYHEALVDEIADAARIEQLTKDGFTVVEVTDTEIWVRPGVAMARVAAALAAL
jgi:hypothetical protein